MRKNDFCINTKEAGSVWGQLAIWDCLELTKKLHEICYLGKYTEYNGKQYVVFRVHETGVNYIVEI